MRKCLIVVLVVVFLLVYSLDLSAQRRTSKSKKKPAAAPVTELTKLREEFVKAGGTVTIVKQGRIAFPKLAPRTDAFRVVASVTVEPQGEPAVKIPFTIHLIALGRGRAEAGLLTMGLGTGVPTADLRAFAKAIATRLAAAKL